jgi:hypothetical protein
MIKKVFVAALLFDIVRGGIRRPRTVTAPSNDPKRDLLRHALATLAYRAEKTVRGVPAGFERFEAGDRPRTPAKILAHLGDLLDWALTQAEGRQVWRDSSPLPWSEEMHRFFEALKVLDEYLASDAPLATTPEKLLQGPIADALTHVGQLAMLRRMAGAPILGENYFKADIEPGRVGPEQPPPKAPFR